MSIKTKKIIVGIATGTLILAGGFSLLPNKMVRFCDVSNKCYTLTQKQYSFFKNALIKKYNDKIPYSYEEYKALIAIWNFEAKKQGGIMLKDATQHTFIDKINQKIQ